MKTIEVVWATAAGLGSSELLGLDPVSIKTISTDQWDGLPDLEVCEIMFRDTNLYEGAAWDLLQPLPEKRTHTALSVGDYVSVDGRMYRCASFGWKPTDTFEPGLRFTDPPSESTFV